MEGRTDERAEQHDSRGGSRGQHAAEGQRSVGLNGQAGMSKEVGTHREGDEKGQRHGRAGGQIAKQAHPLNWPGWLRLRCGASGGSSAAVSRGVVRRSLYRSP